MVIKHASNVLVTQKNEYKIVNKTKSEPQKTLRFI